MLAAEGIELVVIRLRVQRLVAELYAKLLSDANFVEYFCV